MSRSRSWRLRSRTVLAARKRFEREGKSVASVAHEHVVPVFGVAEQNGNPFIVMQYVPGGSLGERIESQGSFDSADVVRIAMQIAKGLAAAHAQGIVHRDVKPGNVLLESNGHRAMVTDFGLARVADAASFTRSDTIAGTPQFMSPEQAKGDVLDERSDLFSLGSVMYAACTGRPPFRSETIFGVIKKVCESEPRPIRDINPKIEPWLVSFISRLHQKNRDNRFRSAEEVAEILSKELAHMQSPVSVAQPTREWDRSATPSYYAIPRFIASNRWTVIALLAFLSIVIAWASGLFQSTWSSATPKQHGKQQAFGKQAAISKEPSQILNLPKFESSIKKTIPVERFGNLFFQSSLGDVQVKTHDKKTVVFKLEYKLSAKNKEIADKLIRHIDIKYEPLEKTKAKEFTEGRDAAIAIQFPTKVVSPDVIRDMDDAEEIKELLKVRNSKYRFHDISASLTVPADFNLNVWTSSGSIVTGDLNGSVELRTSAYSIKLGKITGNVRARTSGGSITCNEIGKKAVLDTSGGRIEVGNIGGSAQAKTSGGHIKLGHVDGPVVAKTSGGCIEVKSVNGAFNAATKGAHISANITGQPKQDSIISNNSSSVNIGVAKKCALRIEAVTENGQITGPFIQGRPSKFSGDLNGGGYKLKVQTETGKIKFHRLDRNPD